MNTGVSLADCVGQGRDIFVAAWCLLLIERKVKDGLIAGHDLDYGGAHKVVDRYLEAGVEPPTDDEVIYGLRFCTAAYPQFALTEKGQASAEFLRMQAGAGKG